MFDDTGALRYNHVWSEVRIIALYRWLRKHPEFGWMQLFAYLFGGRAHAADKRGDIEERFGEVMAWCEFTGRKFRSIRKYFCIVAGKERGKERREEFVCSRRSFIPVTAFVGILVFFKFIISAYYLFIISIQH